MFDQIFGLPAHALIVHAAVVFAPLLALLSVAYAVLPRFRRRLDWALVLTALAGPAFVFAAKQSGQALERRRYPAGAPAPIEVHSGFADVLVPLTALLGVAALALVFVTRPRRSAATVRPAAARAAAVIAGAAAVVLALAVGYYAVRTGHSGAEAVWKA